MRGMPIGDRPLGWMIDSLVVEETTHFTIFEENGKHHIYE